MASLSDPNVKQLLEGRYIGALGSFNPGGSVHIVSVWYWFDGSNIFVATSTRTRKAQNLQANPKASLMIDSRDPAASFGATITGSVKFLTGDLSRTHNEKIHAKYLSAAAIADPKVGPIFAGWDDVTIQITPKSVISWDMREADRQVFSSSFEKNPAYLLPVER